jgi:hypothetical protein
VLFVIYYSERREREARIRVECSCCSETKKKKKYLLSIMQGIYLIGRINKDLFQKMSRETVPRQSGEGKIATAHKSMHKSSVFLRH